MIKEFQGPYRWLSNFWLCLVKFGFDEYKSVEHAYQAAKFYNPKSKDVLLEVIKFQIKDCATPGEAKRLGQRYKRMTNPQWHEIKVKIMEELIREKFKHPNLRNFLLGTENELLQEGNHWGDEFWGVNLKTGKGENHLGKILMKVRKEIQNESQRSGRN